MITDLEFAYVKLDIPVRVEDVFQSLLVLLTVLQIQLATVFAIEDTKNLMEDPVPNVQLAKFR
jgi:hypothetical protein